MGRQLTASGRVILVLLFFSWGLTGVLVRMAVPQFKAFFELGYRDALIIQSAFFLTYLLFARASGSIVARIGLRNGATLGLSLMALGSFLLAAVSMLQDFAALLPCVFIIASGITLLQVAANPLAAIQGMTKSTSGNLTFAQGFNSLGAVAAPLLAAAAFLETDPESLAPIREMFFVIALALGLLALTAHKLLHQQGDELAPDPRGKPLSGTYVKWRLAAGVAAIFLYVGAEVSISTTLVNLLEDDGLVDLSRTNSAIVTSIFWIGMLVGRFAAVPVLVTIGRRITLGVSATIAAVLCLIASQSSGSIAAGAILASGLFAALQFPTIFAIASADLKPKQRARASGWLCLGIVGGGIVPLVYGEVADRVDLQAALVVPALCFFAIAAFAAAFGHEPDVSGRAEATPGRFA